MTKDLTPLMRQYWDVKSLHPDKVLLFRMGDFFEMFHEDAKIASPILGITLTSRNKKALDETPMCGVPHHSIAGICNKLLKAGHKVAICDQLEDPKLAKGLVKRGVTRILTPGMVYDSDNLAPDLSNYIACMDQEGTAAESAVSLSLADASSGEAFYFLLATEQQALDLLKLFPVAELLVQNNFVPVPGASWMCTVFAGEPDAGHSQQAGLPQSAKKLLSYIHSLGGDEALRVLQPFEQRRLQSRMRISSTVLRHLEVFSTYRGEKEGSFFQAIDRTKTSTGTRLLRQWLSFPLMNIAEISQRQNSVKKWIDNLSELKKIRELLAVVGDLERRLGKVASPQANARDLQALAQSLTTSFAVQTRAGLEASAELQKMAADFERTFCEELPLSVKQGSLIRRGVRADLDEWIELSTNSQGLLLKMEEEERVRTGISSLKIRYNNIFGYYIEITHTHKDKIPENYLRKQTLVNAERFCTPELIELEKKVLAAQTRRSELEYEIFLQYKEQFLRSSMLILGLAQEIAEIDVFTALAWLAVEQNLTRPTLSERQGEREISLKASRHPVVEQVVGHHFMANDFTLAAGNCLLLTGPNMAGKSTLMRQVALTSLLAQVGSYVPASAASLPVFDAIYTRIGASDMLSEGLSTFMVEMKETAQMLAEVTSKSLVVLDEVGRGTSTYDGMALAQSLLEELVVRHQCMTLFATHYHELTELETVFPQIKNAHMSVIEKNGEIQFLHSLRAGAAGKSYGIQVGCLAGLPKSVTDRASKILKKLELDRHRLSTEMSSPMSPDVSSPMSPQMSLLEMNFIESAEKSLEDNNLSAAWLEKIKKFDVVKKTPLEALLQISEWQNELQ